MRVDGWKGKEVFEALGEAALRGANNAMADHAADARRRCPTREGVSIGARYRAAGTVVRDVLFTTKRGRDVNFLARTEVGRVAGSLQATIRKVERYNRPGNIRVYAGTNEIFYARFVEYGTSKTKAQPYMRPSFEITKKTYKAEIEAEMRKVPEVKQ